MTATSSILYPDVRIDGERLKQARLAKDWHIDDASLRITISRAQMQQIESGEEHAFYSRSHKLLAVKKYADALGLPFDTVVTVHAPVPVESAMAGMQAGTPAQHDAPVPPAVAAKTGLARRRAAPGWRQTLTIMTPLIVVFALMAQFVPARDDAAPTITEMIALPVTPAPAITAPTRAMDDASAVTVAAPAGLLEAASAPLAETPPVERALVTTVAGAVRLAANGNICGTTAGQPVPDWAPVHVRKPDTTVYLRSAGPGTVCITDANGTSEAIALKPQVLHTFAGKPPYTLRAEQFSQLDVYFQGLRVRVPFEVQAVRLIAGNI